MMARRCRLPVTLSALALGLPLVAMLPGSAHACSDLPPGVSQRAWPPPGAIAVPTNTRPVIHYDALGLMSDPWISDLGTHLQLRRKDGAAVALTTETIATVVGSRYWNVAVVLTPSEPLAPATQYELVDRKWLGVCLQSCEFADPAVFASFTTGMGRDDSAPQLPGKGSILDLGIATCESASCCGPYRIKQYELHWPAGTDDVSSVLPLYNLYVAGQTEPVRRLLEAPRFYFALPCSGSGSRRETVPPGRYSVRPVDWSGNEGPAVEVGTVPSTCESPAAAPPAVEAADKGGFDCGVGGSDPPASPVVLLAAVLTAARSLRHRRRR
jgi:hypothetical protein